MSAYVPPIGAQLGLLAPSLLPVPTMPAAPAAPTAPSVSFSQLIANGLDSVNAKLTQADSAVKAFTLDDSIPVHQVTFALEEARQSLELMLQMRTRLIEGYQQLMNMQL